MVKFIFKVMWDYVSCFKCAGDMVTQGVSNARVEDELSILTYGRGLAAQSYSSANHF